MNALKNKVQLIGWVCQKPEIRVRVNGTRSAKFIIMVSESYRDARGVRVVDRQWHSLIVTGKLVELAEKSIDKGREIAIEGRLINRSYQDKEGNKRTITEIQVNEILLLGFRLDSIVEEDIAPYYPVKSGVLFFLNDTMMISH